MVFRRQPDVAVPGVRRRRLVVRASHRVVRGLRSAAAVARVRRPRAVRAAVRVLLRLLGHGARGRIVPDTGIAALPVGRHFLGRPERRPRVLHRTETTVIRRRQWRRYETVNAVQRGIHGTLFVMRVCVCMIDVWTSWLPAG